MSALFVEAKQLAPSVTKRRRGLTLLETVIAIVIGLVILAGIGTLVYKAISTNKVAEAYSDFSTIAGNLRDLYSGASQTPSTSMSVYINAGVFPERMVTGSSTAVNPWGGDVYVNAASTNGLWVMFGAVPKEACIQLSQKLPEIASDDELDINGYGRINPTITEADSYCNSNSNRIGPRITLTGG